MSSPRPTVLPGTKRFIRWAMMLIMFVPAGLGVYYFWRFLEDRSAFLALEPIPFTDGVKAAATQKIEAAKSTLQHALLILAALWGMFLAKKKEERFLTLDQPDDLPEVVLFWSATFGIAGVWFCCSTYLNIMAEFHAKVKPITQNTIPNFLDEKIDSYVALQTHFLMIATLLGGWVLFSSHLLKEKST